MLFLRLGWTNVLITNPRDLPRFIKELRRYPFAFLSGVNKMFGAPCSHNSEFAKVDFSHPENRDEAAAWPMQETVARRWIPFRKSLTQAWGLTETSPGACINVPFTDFNGSIGLPIAQTEDLHS